jgi:hypothetical protein
MSVNNFIPEIWSASVFDTFKKNLVFGSLANTDYQGEIKQYGDTVRINEIGDITINAYTKNSTTAITVQELADSQQVLTVDRARYWGFKIDDLDQAQTNPKLMAKAMERAAYNLKDETDSYLATLISTGNFFSGTNSTELGSTTTALSAASTAVVVAFSWYDRIMNQNNVPTNGRWIVVPPAIAQQLVNARIIAETANTQVMNEGTRSIGNFYGFDVFVSNNVYGVPSSQWHVIAGHSAGLTFAGQLTKVEAYRDQNSFSDVVRGLYVYGAKITRPNAIIKGVLTSS